MPRPRCLDLFCGAGGSAMGLYRAGFDIVGVDLKAQPHYPFEFHQGDALTYPLDGFDCYWASPPCQAYSIMRNLPWLKDKEYPRFIDPIRERLARTVKPSIIENVMGAHLAAGYLCGGMFGLPFYRHRAFETNFFWLQPGHPKHKTIIQAGRNFGDRGHRSIGVQGCVGNGAQRRGANIGHSAGVALARNIMGIDWMTRDELTQAIPPVYSEYLGKYLMEACHVGL